VSRENLERFQVGLDAWNRRDFDAILDLCAPDVEWTFSNTFPDATGVIKGRDAVRKFLHRFADDWSEISIVPHQIVDPGDHVVADVQFVATGRDGIEVSMRFGHVWTERDGEIVGFRAYPSFDEAVADVRGA